MDNEKPEGPKEIADQARALIKNKNYAQALSLCEETESSGLRDGELYALHAFALIELKKYPEASALIDEMLKDYPTEPHLYYSQAYLKIRQEKFKDALAICDHAASIGAWNNKLAYIRSNTLAMLGRYDEAIVFLQQELEKYPDDAGLHFGLGNVYRLFKGKESESKHEFETAIALDPTLGKVREKIRLNKVPQGLLYCFAIYIAARILFSPAPKYSLITLCLFGIASSFVGLYFSLRKQRFQTVLMWFSFILLFSVRLALHF